MKKFTCLIMLLLFFVVTSCASLTDKGMISLEILKDNVAVNELDVRVGDIFQLEAETTQEVTEDILWVSSNPEVLNIDNQGNVTVLKNGNDVVSAYVDGKG